jgi:hypothetical protein
MDKIMNGLKPLPYKEIILFKENPKDLIETLVLLEKWFVQNEKDFLFSETENIFLSEVSLLFLRSSLDLWNPSRPIVKWFKNEKIAHADDISMILSVSLWRKVNNKPIRLEDQIKIYHKYWEREDPEYYETLLNR